MPLLLDRAPIPREPSEVVVHGERVRLRANQIIVWVSLTSRPTLELTPVVRAFPAILDTGHTHTFSVQSRHLVEWAGVSIDALPVTGIARERGRRVTRRAARIWIRPSATGSQDRLAHRPPFLLTNFEGIAVYPPELNFPRLPILGLRAISDNRLVLTINGHRREATLRTAYRCWPFAGR
jgi:hypothetical protein